MVLGGFRWFHVLVTTINYIFTYNYLQLLNVHETDCNLIECFFNFVFDFVLLVFLLLFTATCKY